MLATIPDAVQLAVGRSMHTTISNTNQLTMDRHDYIPTAHFSERPNYTG